MSTALTKSIDSAKAFSRLVHSAAIKARESSPFAGGTSGLSILDNKNDARAREGYASFGNWLYSAVHALAMEAAAQEVTLAKLKGVNSKASPKGSKSHLLRKMPARLRSKAAEQELSIVLDHPARQLLDSPNEMQGRWQFIYSAVANLNITGWTFIVFDTDGKDKQKMYSVPTNWVRPDHTDGPFSKFYVVNPKDPSSITDQKPLTRDNVAFAYLPDPSNPLNALAPATSQLPAIRIDDFIQFSQLQYFKNGIFPSVVVTMGRNPLNDAAGGGLRPTLTGVQRRQITAAINSAMAGVANLGTPAIIDGLIESITKLSMSGEEMGWAQSEEKARTRILSAFGVHPFILGEPLGVGGYAQAAIITDRFYKRVNACLSMVSDMLTKIVSILFDDLSLIAYVEECIAVDRSLRQAGLMTLRGNNDISQNEIRAEFGFPPDEDKNESILNTALLSQVVAMIGLVGQGMMQRDQFVATLQASGVPNEVAEKIAGAPSEKVVVEQAVDSLGQAVEELKKTVNFDLLSILRERE